MELNRALQWDKTAGLKPVPEQDLNHSTVRLAMDLINEEVNGDGELLDSYHKGNLKGVIDGLGDALKVLAFGCYSLNIHPEDLLKEINDSNFSKFCKTEKAAKNAVNKYKTKHSDKYKDVFYEKVGKLYVIKGWKVGQDTDKEAPKVLKANTFKDLNLDKFINKEQ